jgi:hypothetical protein
MDDQLKNKVYIDNDLFDINTIYQSLPDYDEFRYTIQCEDYYLNSEEYEFKCSLSLTKSSI